MLYELIPLRWINLFRLCRQVRNLQISIPSQLRWKWFRIMSRQIQKLIVDNKKTILEVLFRRDSISQFFSPNFEKRWLIWSKKVTFFFNQSKIRNYFCPKLIETHFSTMTKILTKSMIFGVFTAFLFQCICYSHHYLWKTHFKMLKFWLTKNSF